MVLRFKKAPAAASSRTPAAPSGVAPQKTALHLVQTPSAESAARLRKEPARLPAASPCHVCRSKDLMAINFALLQGESVRSIAERTSFSKSSLDRHREHLPRALVDSWNSQRSADAAKLLDRMRELLQFVSSVRLQAAHSGNLQAALNAAGHEHKIISNFLKLLSERNEVAELTFTASPQYKQLRALVLRVTEPHEAARLALAEALIEFEKEQ